MNQSRPSCQVIIDRVGPWFYLSSVEVEMPHNLKPERFSSFDYGLDFAGCSARRLCLSVKRSAGPARIGPYPLLEKAPASWVSFNAPVPGLLLRTDRPRLSFVGINQGSGYECYEALAMPREDLAAIVEIPEPRDRQRQSTEFNIGNLSLDIVKLIARYATQLKLVHLKRGLHVRVLSNLSLAKGEWQTFGRYLFTGNSAGCAADTVTFWDDERSSGRYIKLPGRSLSEIASRWGIIQEKPFSYNGDEFLFRSIHVHDASKLCTLYPASSQLAGRRLRVVDDPDALASYNLSQAVKADIIPPQREIIIDSKVERIFLPAGQVQIPNLKAPLEFRAESCYERAGLLCPWHLVKSCLLGAAKAARTYRIPSRVTKFEVRSLDPETQQLIDFQGTYYLISDLTSLPLRDLKGERSEKKARFERLLAQYGNDLPNNYEKHSDQELNRYFAIRGLLTRGEIRLTDVGCQLLEHAKRTAELSDAIENVISTHSANVTGTLRLSAPPSISDSLIAPLIGSFQTAYPDVRIQVFITDRIVDQIAEGVDVAFRVGELKDSSLVARRLLTYRHQVVASPAYLKTCKAPKTPQDLLGHQLLAFFWRPTYSWNFTRASGKQAETITFEPYIGMNDYAGLAAALLAGVGIGELPPIVQPELIRKGLLVEVMPTWHLARYDLSLIHLGNRYIPRHVRVFKEFAALMTPKLFPELPT